MWIRVFYEHKGLQYVYRRYHNPQRVSITRVSPFNKTNVSCRFHRLGCNPGSCPLKNYITMRNYYTSALVPFVRWCRMKTFRLPSSFSFKKPLLCRQHHYHRYFRRGRLRHEAALPQGPCTLRRTLPKLSNIKTCFPPPTFIPEET